MKNIYSILSLLLVLISTSVVGQTKIYAPDLRAPEDMQIGQMPNVILDWDAVTGITLNITYELQLASNPEFTDAITFPRTSVTAETMSDLLFGNKYFWRVRAYDNEEVSGWSETRSFSVVWAVSMLKPNDGDDEIFSNPTITWNEITGISEYTLQLDTTYAWNVEESGVTSDIFSSFIVADDDMWLVGEAGVILHNDGSSWVNVESGVTANLNDVCFVDAANGFAVGDGGIVLSYDGSSWTTIDVGTTSNLLGVSFIDINNGVVVGDGGVVVTYAGGTWTIQTTGDSNDLFDVDMIDASNIWACGGGKIVLNFDGAMWNANVVGNKDHYSIAMIDENNGWVVGKGGKILGWNGTEWTEVTSGTSKDLNSVSFSGNMGMAVGKSGTTIMYDGVWSKSTSMVNTDLYGVMISSNNGLSVGKDGAVVQKTGEGFNSPFLASFNIQADEVSLLLGELLFGQKYYYRLNAIHGADTSLWSGVKSFTTLASPVLSSPANSSTTDLYIKFEWEEYEGTTNYIFEVDDNYSFTQPRSFSPDDDSLWVNDLVFGQEYFWRVAAQHEEDISYWSDIWSFTTVNSISLESPTNNETDVAPCPSFVWTGVAGASGYELWVDTDATFGNAIVIMTDDPNYQCESQLDKNTDYFWKVRGKAGVDVSGWSDTWTFKTEGPIGILEQISNDNVSIYPNPGDGNFVINFNSSVTDDFDISVFDISGKVIYTSKVRCNVGENNIAVSIDNIISGSYNLVIRNNTQVATKRLVIE